ncbi:MAG: hypothetical protein AAFP76_04975 [Bacteroidota bacterium]
MKFKHFFIAIISLILLGCERDNQANTPEMSEDIANLNFRISNTLEIQSLIEESTIDYEYSPENSDLTFKSFYTPESFFNAFKENGNEIETIVIFDGCADNTIRIGSYMFSENTGNLYFNLYKNLDDFHDGITIKSYIVNDYIYNDLMYIRASRFENCNISIFFSEELEKREYTLDYNDLSLESAFLRPPVDAFDPGPGGNIRHCSLQHPACRIYNYDPTKVYHCPQNRGCKEAPDCPFFKGKQYMVVNNYPDYLHYFESVILDDTYYRFKDEILAKSEFGRRYGKLFYAVGGQFTETLDFELTAKLLAVLPKINTSIDNLFDEQYQGIIINTELEQEINVILSASIDKSSSTLYQEVLNSFQDDFAQFVNKSKNEVLDQLKD